MRTKFLLLAALGFSLLVATADLAVKILYDEPYHAASWMLPILFTGSWFSMLAHLNESTLLSLGKPSLNAMSSTLKFIFVVVALPLSVGFFGLVSGIMIVASAELCRYVPGLIGLRRAHFSFGMQDLLFTLTAFLLVAVWEWIRFMLGFGTSFDSLFIS